ncbi:MAG: hypothetical protein Q9178_004454 [Gyalolechia marmorata]
MDPFSTVAGAAGIVTLGLQVCGGFIRYCNEWKSYNKDIEETLEKLTELEHTLKTIGETLRIVEDIDYSTTDNLQLARRKIYSTQANLNKLYSGLNEVESIDDPAGMLDKVHNLRLRSTRFFSREKFNSWRSSITEIHSNLLSAIQFLQLHLAMSSSVVLKDLQKANNEGIDKISDTIERKIDQRFEQQGQKMSILHRDVLSASSQHAQVSLQQTQTMQQVAQDIAALQLGVMQKPSLLHTTLQEKRRMLSQNMNTRSRPVQPCTCRALFKYKPLIRSRSYNMDGKNLAAAKWNAGSFTSTLVHRPGCAEAQEEKQIGLRISFSGRLIQGAIQAAMSMTRGAGGFSISPVLAYSPVVPSGTGPFRVIRMVDDREEIHASDLRTALGSWTQELLQLYQAGKASPRDVDGEGNNIMHIACTIFDNCLHIISSSDIEAYFEFLRNLYNLGVPLNTTNAEGMTPFGSLFLANEDVLGLGESELSTSMTAKMLNLGAELPIFTQVTEIASYSLLAVGLSIGLCPEVAEAFSCNEISKAIQAKDMAWLTEAILRKPELINEPNIMGQTSLHFSVVWPAGIQMLLETSADVDAIDHFGNTPIFYAVAHSVPESIKLLGKANCRLTGNTYILCTNRTDSILQWATATESGSFHRFFRPEASRKDLEAMLNASISLVVERRRSLEALVQTLLGAQAVKRLQISPGAVLDRKASFAISMLRDKADVPDSMMAISPSHSTVYHLPELNVRQARIFWDNGFRDVDELDDLGQSALMKSDPVGRVDEHVKFVAWLVEKGAKLHNREKYTFRERKDELAQQVRWVERDGIFRSNDSSSTTALHYLASRWAICTNMGGFTDSSEDSRIFIRTVLTAPLSDCCDCACSDRGCAAFTMWMKETRGRYTHKGKLITKKLWYLTQLLNMNTPSLVWLRRGIVRFSTFVRLELDHTCCQMHKWLDIIYSPYEKEDIVEINEEQSERLEKLEALLIEFENKYNESTWSFSEFMEGYWEDRMAEILSEEPPIDHRALENIGVRLRRADELDEIF